MIKVDGASVDFARITRLNAAPTKENIEAALNTATGAFASRL